MTNDWEFAKVLQTFKTKVLDPQEERTAEAFKIMTNPEFKWRDDEQKKLGQAKLDNYRVWLDHYKEFYAEGSKLIQDHEALVEQLCKWYQDWYANISNEGIQETELMNMQAELLQKIFTGMYEALKPLKLEIKPPQDLIL